MRWIDIDKKLPPLGQGVSYLVLLADGEIRVEKYYARMKDGEIWHSWELVYQPKSKMIKFWMPLPKPPVVDGVVEWRKELT